MVSPGCRCRFRLRRISRRPSSPLRLREQAVVGVGEADVVELDVTLAVDEVDGVGSVDDGGLLVEDLVDPLGRGRGALAHHDQHPEHHEGGLHHDQVEVERDDGGDRQVLVDDHPSADEQDEDEADLGEVLHQWGEAGAQVGVLDVAPLHPVGRRGQLAQLLLLGGEAAHDAHAVDVLVHDGRHLGQAGLDDPRHREERLPHLHAHDVDERHRRHGHEGQRHADGEHEGEGDHARWSTARGSSARRSGTSARSGCPSWPARSAARTAPGRRRGTTSA